MKLMKKRLRAAVILLALSLSVTLIITATSKRTSNGEAAEITYVNYCVKPGDTLWDIAEEYSDNNVDLRKFISEIEEKNQLKGADIYIGDSLLVPTTYCGK